MFLGFASECVFNVYELVAVLPTVLKITEQDKVSHKIGENNRFLFLFSSFSLSLSLFFFFFFSLSLSDSCFQSDLYNFDDRRATFSL